MKQIKHQHQANQFPFVRSRLNRYIPPSSVCAFFLSFSFFFRHSLYRCIIDAGVAVAVAGVVGVIAVADADTASDAFAHALFANF